MKTKDWLLCILVLMIWSSSSALVSTITSNADPILVAGMVVVVSTIVLSLQMLSKNRREYLKTFTNKELCKLILPASLGVFLYPIAYFVGISGASPIKANVLNYLWPLIAFIASGTISRKKFDKIEILSMIFATVGGYIVLCFNGSMEYTFLNSNIKYILVAFSGAVFYGLYTAIIERMIPAERNNASVCYDGMQKVNYLPASYRIYIMVSISFVLFLPIFFYYFIFNPTAISNTFSMVLFNQKGFGAFLTYSIINFTLAHFLWNKINTVNNISLTASMAFLIPLASTILLSVTSGMPIGVAPSIGLILIVVSIILSNIKYINSINTTFVGIIILCMLLGITPVTQNEAIIDNSKFFLELIIAIFSIYYGFVMNRVIADYKQVEQLIDSLSIYKSNISKGNRVNFELLEKKLAELKKNNKEIQSIELYNYVAEYFPKKVSKGEKRDIIEQYYLLYRCSEQALTVSEWLIILILSILIISLCFIVREEDLLSNIVVVAIGATNCLLVSTLYEYEVKKRNLLK